MDQTNVTFVTIPKELFQKYEIDKPRDIKINGVYMKKIFSKVSKDDNIFLSFDDNYSQIKITLSSTKFKKSYEVSLLQITAEDSVKRELPQMEHDIQTKYKNADIKEMLDGMVFSGEKGFGDTVQIIGDGERIEVKEETSYGKTILTLKDFDKVGIKKKETVKVGLALLKPLIELQARLCENGIYYIKTDYPIKVVSKNDDIETSFILAPRVTND
jgi:hypothetical protein